MYSTSLATRYFRQKDEIINLNSDTHPRTGRENFSAALATSRYRIRLSSIVQLIFDFEKDSEAEANTATSLAPAATAASRPYLYGIMNINVNHQSLTKLSL